MNIAKNKANLVLFLSLSLCFTTVHVSAANGKRSLFVGNSGLVAANSSIAAHYMSESGQTPPEGRPGPQTHAQADAERYFRIVGTLASGA